jgi:formylglycine-generating enzyme required for sulfatase activity
MSLLDKLDKHLIRAFEPVDLGLEKRYLNALVEQHRWLKWIGIDSQPRLQKVFTSLCLASDTLPEDGPRFGWQQILDEHKIPTVILGHPGAGKTTLLDYLVLVFSGRIAHTLPKKLGAPFPLFANLRDLGAQNCPSLLEALQPENSAGLGIPQGYLERRLREQCCVVLLDGLDEVIDPVAHARVVAEIQRFANEFPGNHMVVTCRVAGWCGQLPCWRVYQIQDFQTNDAQHFINTWYREVLRIQEIDLLGPQPAVAAVVEAERRAYVAAQVMTEHLWDALRGKEGLLRIARTPLILSMIALVYKIRSSLPMGRTGLYQTCFDILLEQWCIQDARCNQPDPPSREDKLLALEHIADTFLRWGVVELDEYRLEELLAQFLSLLTCRLCAHDLLRQIVERSGMLVQTRVGVYGFAHRVMADQLTANLVVNHSMEINFVASITEDGWREVILMATSRIPSNRAEQLVSALLAQGSHSPTRLAVAGWSLVEDSQICSEQRRRVKERIINEVNQTRDPVSFTLLAEALLAADSASAEEWVSMILSGQNNRLRQITLTLLSDVNPEAGRFFVPLLIRLLGNDHEPPDLRARAAMALAKLATRPDNELWQVLQSARQPSANPLLKSAAIWAWCELGRFEKLGLLRVPAGEFLMGSDPRLDSEAGDREQPQHSLYLPTFYIAKYPVTVAEWLAYGAASGREPRSPWSKDGPENHPVRRVTWAESLAYTQWYGFSLPSEAEWEKSVRGIDGQIYPWGNSWRMGLANTNEYWQRKLRDLCSKLFWWDDPERTTPVGQFSPGGDSAYQGIDVTGNIWEWTRSQFAPYPYDPQDGREELLADNPRVLRGGAFSAGRRYARCAYRNYDIDPDFMTRSLGFRVAVVSPP